LIQNSMGDQQADISGAKRGNIDPDSNELVGGDTTPLFKARTARPRACPACGEPFASRTAYCANCGYFHGFGLDGTEPTSESAQLQINGNSVLRDKYRLSRFLGSWAGVSSFVALVEDGGRLEPVILKVAPKAGEAAALATNPHTGQTTLVTRRRVDIPTDQITKPASSAAADTQPEDMLKASETARRRAYQQLELEYEILNQCDSRALPKTVDLFEEGEFVVLATTAACGIPLLKAWKNPNVSLSVKLSWLEQLRDAMAQIQRHYVIFPSLQPSRIVIDNEQLLRIRDVQGIVGLPLENIEDVAISCYTAPELVNDPHSVGLRADAYTFGSILYALHLGHELSEADFEPNGAPRPFALRVPDAHPALVRLISKTFARRVEMRFPPPTKPEFDPSGFDEIGKALAEYARDVTSVRYDIAGWSSTGLVRANNEDCFTISHLSAGAGEHRRDIALLCVADGMGGHSSGEVASSMAVSAVADYLRQHGLSSALTHQLGANHPFHDSQRCSQLLREASLEANRRVCEAASADPSRAGMGCTLDAILLVGRQGVAAHIGDSRIYHRSAKKFRQISKDHTVANRLVELGQLRPEDVAANPHRSELCQAIGSKLDIQPSQHFLELSEGDWVLACSDGLTEHVSEQDINDVLETSDSAETATRRLINLANLNGGSDNVTIVVAHVR
jgi:protein phosphatase